MNRYQYAQTGRALPMCGDCGAIIGDTTLHDKHHAETEAMTMLNISTAMNLLAVVSTLIEAGIDVDVDVSEIPQ